MICEVTDISKKNRVRKKSGRDPEGSRPKHKMKYGHDTCSSFTNELVWIVTHATITASFFPL